MDRASPDLLLIIFKELNSKEMVSVMRVERKWLQIIDEHKSLWRELVLPPRRSFDGWGIQTLKLFDQKSNSTLKRVSMSVSSWAASDSFVETLERSRDTLRILDIRGVNWKIEEALEESLWKLPHLVDCRLSGPSFRYYELRLQLLGRIKDQVDDKGSSLRVLWVRDSSEKLIESHLHLLDNLVSLLLDGENYDSSEMRRILERPSRTLKHLHVKFEEDEEPQIPTLIFPNLKFLDITLYNESLSVFPSWMKLPSLSILIIYHWRTLSSLPACSKLWLVELDEFDDLSKLGAQCPELVELRMDLSDMGRDEDLGGELSALERFENLSSMLNQRKVNVEAGVEIEGVKMINLKTLVIPFNVVEFKGENGSKEVGLSKLRGLVEEVVDLREKISERSEIIKMEV